MTTNAFYITTPLYYVNDKPHLGHAYTTVAADVITRWHKMHGRPAHFLTGTDEHGQKVADAAKKFGKTPQEHVDSMVEPFRALWEKLDIQFDDFIRTTEERHTSVVKAVLNKLHAEGEIYEDNYEGWYSTSAERFWTEKDLVDGKCPDTGLEVEWIQEKNYFFRMSKYADQLRQWIVDHPTFIQPESRKNEVLGYLKKDVGDLCISRPKSRLSWGIELPFDTDYVTYVWFDALLNYITALGYHPDESKCSSQFGELWPANFQLVGKDILTTHSVYWSTMLFALGLEPTKSLYAHGWWTVEGQKMSKSLGNVVDPHLLVDNYGLDSVRYFMLRHIPFGGDGNFAHDDFLIRYNSDLANGIGNLYQRSIGLLQNSHNGLIPELGEKTEHDIQLEEATQTCVAKYCESIENLQFFHALEALQELIQIGNRYIQVEQPWKLMKIGEEARCGQVMRYALEVCRVAGWLLHPIMPNKCGAMLSALGVTDFSAESLSTLDALTAGVQTTMGAPLFPKMKKLPADIQVARDRALGIEPVKEKSSTAPATKKIKLKHFQAVPFQSGVVLDIKTGETQTLTVDIGTEEALIISGNQLPTLSTDAVGQGVVVVGPTSIENFEKIELRAGQIKQAAGHPEAEKLLVMKVDVGEPEPRNIVAGIANRFSPEELIDQKVTVVANLKPSKLRGVKSEGMLMAAGGDRLQSLVTAGADFTTGTPMTLFGSGDTFILIAQTETGTYLQALSETTEPGAVVR